jgi:hypothetical protein
VKLDGIFQLGYFGTVRGMSLMHGRREQGYEDVAQNHLLAMLAR